MQRAKEMLWSGHSNFCTISLKSETNDRSAFKRFSVPIPNDVPASTMSSFLSRLTVLPTSSFLHFHVPTNGHFLSMNHVPKDFPAVTTSSFLQRYVLTTALQALSATTVTTTATMTQVPATAIMNAPKYQIDKCKATRSQHKKRSPSICIPPKRRLTMQPQDVFCFYLFQTGQQSR